MMRDHLEKYSGQVDVLLGWEIKLLSHDGNVVLIGPQDEPYAHLVIRIGDEDVSGYIAMKHVNNVRSLLSQLVTRQELDDVIAERNLLQRKVDGFTPVLEVAK